MVGKTLKRQSATKLQKLQKNEHFCEMLFSSLFGKGIFISNTDHNHGSFLIFYVIFEAYIRNRCDFMEKIRISFCKC